MSKRQSKAPGTVTVGDLKPAPYNPRVIDDAALAVLGQSMKDLGDCSGIVVNVRSGNTIVGGHQRAKHLDPAWPITREPVADSTGTVALGHVETPFGRWAVRFVDWPAEKERRANLAANQIGGEWDTTALEAMLRDMPDADRMLAGFDMGAMKELGIDMGGEEQADAPVDQGRAEALRRKWRVKRGQLWAVGDHRILCGDSTRREDVDRVMGGERAAMILTSPPYPGASMWADGDQEKPDVRIARLDELNESLLRSAFGLLNDGGVALWNIADVPFGNHGMVATTTTTTTACKKIGFTMRGAIIWDKGVPNLPPPSFMRRPAIPAMAHETVLLLFKGDWLPREVECGISPDDKQWLLKSVWPIATEHAKVIGHKAPFPIELARRCVCLWSIENDVVVDLCLGSGTTLITCQNVNRKCRALELDPAYFALSLERAHTAFPDLAIKRL